MKMTLRMCALLAAACGIAFASLGADPAPGYAMQVGGKDLKVEYARCSAMPVNIRWPGHQRELDQTEICGYARFDFTGPVELRVKPGRAWEKAQVRPLAKGVVPVRDGDALAFTIPSPGTYSLELDGRHRNLMIVADRPADYSKVSRTAPGVRYFGPGEHDVGLVTMKSGETLYLDAGAVVYGRVFARDAKGIKILGRGILDASRVKEVPVDIDPKLAAEQKRKGWAITNVKRFHTVDLHFCDDAVVEGITIRDSQVYAIRPVCCANLTIENVKVIGSWRYNSDGIDMHNCRNVKIKNCFIRTYDDSICVKGFDYCLKESEMNHGGGVHDLFENVLVEGCTIWNDWGRALEIGAETRAREIRNITFRDCDILAFHAVALDVQNCDQAHVHLVTFENIRVEYPYVSEPTRYSASAKGYDPEAYEPDPLLAQAIVHYIAEYSKAGAQNRGKISDIRYKDIFVTGRRLPNGSLVGFDKQHGVARVTFENIRFNGRDATGAFVKNVTCNPFAAKPVAAMNPWFDARGNFIGDPKRGPMGGCCIAGTANGRMHVTKWGWADEVNKVKFDENSIGWIASNSKAMAAATFLTLVDDGLVKLDDPVSKYLPEFAKLTVKGKDGKVRPAKTVMTCRHVLSHTSGLPFFCGGWPIDNRPMRLLAQIGAQRPLDADPGTRYAYSNWGIDVAMAVVEAVTGLPWEDRLQKRVLDPLEMKDTTFWPNAEQMRRFAKGYTLNPDGSRTEAFNVQLQWPLDLRSRFAEGGGGLYGTASDLFKFFRMIANRGLGETGRRVLKESTIREWYKKQTAPSIKDMYSFGMVVDPANATIGHGGAWFTHGEANWRDGTVRIWFVQCANRPKDVADCRAAWDKVSKELVALPPTAWTDGECLPIEGRGYATNDLVCTYSRLPLSEKKDIPLGVWWLQQEPASLAFRFKTDADRLRVKYLLRHKPVSSPHNPSTSKSGVDVYQRNAKGGWDYIAPHFPQTQPINVECCWDVPVAPGVETLVYLPCYNSVENIAFGVAPGKKITPLPKPSKKPVVVYGTSITQGGCSSRPGTAWPNVAGREANLEIINLGFSGSGRMEIGLAHCLAKIDAALYVLDNVSNLNPDEAREKLEPFLRYLKEKRPTTPIMVTHNAWVIHSPNVATTWKLMRATVKRLKAEDPAKWANLSLGGEGPEFQLDRDYTVDGLHMADWGMMNVGKAFAREFLQAIGR